MVMFIWFNRFKKNVRTFYLFCDRMEIILVLNSSSIFFFCEVYCCIKELTKRVDVVSHCRWHRLSKTHRPKMLWKVNYAPSSLNFIVELITASSFKLSFFIWSRRIWQGSLSAVTQCLGATGRRFFFSYFDYTLHHLTLHRIHLTLHMLFMKK